MQTNRRSRPLYRDPNDKMLGGVCSGLGHYFDIDTVLVRVGFVAIALIGGGGALAYAILWAILDSAPPQAPPPADGAEMPTADGAAGTGGIVADRSETTREVLAPEESRIEQP